MTNVVNKPVADTVWVCSSNTVVHYGTTSPGLTTDTGQPNITTGSGKADLISKLTAKMNELPEATTKEEADEFDQKFKFYVYKGQIMEGSLGILSDISSNS